MKRAGILSLILASLTGPASAAEPAKLQTLAGASTEGTLLRITDRDVALQTTGGEVTHPVGDVLDVFMPAASPVLVEGEYSEVLLTDGTRLYGTKLAVVKDQVRLSLNAGPEARFPLKAVSYILNDARTPQVQQQWQGFLKTRGNQDLMAVVGSDGAINTLPGTVGEGNADGTGIEFEIGPDTKRLVGWSKIRGIAFVRAADAPASSALCKVSDTAHDVLMAAHVSFSGDRFTVESGLGLKVELPQGVVTRLDYSQGKLAYLSDLEPAKVTETSNIEGTDHFHRDKNLDNGPLRVLVKSDFKTEAKTFQKGIAVHATTELLYDLGGQYKEFRALLGVDPKVGGDSHVKVTIEGDGNELFQAEIDRKALSRPLECDVRNVRMLRIVVQPAGILDLGNHVNFADAKLIK